MSDKEAVETVNITKDPSFAIFSSPSTLNVLQKLNDNSNHFSADGEIVKEGSSKEISLWLKPATQGGTPSSDRPESKINCKNKTPSPRKPNGPPLSRSLRVRPEVMLGLYNVRQNRKKLESKEKKKEKEMVNLLETPTPGIGT